MRGYQITTWCILIGCIANFTAMNTAYALTLTQTTSISTTDSSYDGQDLIVDGATLTIDGSHQFNSVRLINGAILTHSLSPADKLEITSNTFFIDTTSHIDLTGKGELPTSEVTGSSGGSYGGLGGIYVNGGTTNPVFGSPTLPTDFGIGGIGVEGAKTHGGGSIKLTTDLLAIDGRIIANGAPFNTFFRSQGGGSGGSILLDVGILNGSGTLESSGGSGYTFYGGAGGGGGRIAVYYDSATFDFQKNIINLGGVCKPLFGDHGQPGSIHLENKMAANQTPIIDAGSSRAVTEQSNVTLTGSATDSDGVITSYNWTQLSGPTVQLINANSAIASFTAPIVLSNNSPTVLQFRLTAVDDLGAVASADTSIGVLAVNIMPVSNAGSDISVNENTGVTLNGTSSDADGSVIHCQWTQISGTTVALSNSTEEITSFKTPVLKNMEQLGFRMTVTDNESGTHSDDIIVTVNPVNALPVAKITNLSPLAENTLATLDGSTSNDTDGVITRYNWTQLNGPVVTLINPTGATTGFKTPSVYQDTTLSFRLDILDDEGGAASTITHLSIFDVNKDDDDDGMLDLWEIQSFNTLTHDGSTDTDNDGASDLEEHNFATDPTIEQQPAQPDVVSPDDIEVTSLQPELTLINPKQHPGFPVRYEFEVYKDAAMTDLITSTSGASLNWTVDNALSDNTEHYWRARAFSATLFSGWVSSKFFVNTANDAPENFNVSYPLDGTWVSSFTPTLSVTNSVDIDGDSLSYQFEVYADTNLITASGNILSKSNGTSSWQVDVALLENNIYQWRAIVTDEHGLSTISSTEPMIFINTVNDAPETPTLNTPVDDSEITMLDTDLIISNSSDPEGEAVHYVFELDTVNTFDSSNKQSSDAITETPIITAWYVNGLLDNTWYHWRTKASDGLSDSLWTNARFFVNQFNDAPGTTKALNPGDHAWTGNLQPTLEVYPALDIDGDALNYEFKVYKVVSASVDPELVTTGISDTTFWQLDNPLIENGYYYWHARAIDEHGLAGEWGELVMFFADNDGINETPSIQLKNLNNNNRLEHGDRHHNNHYDQHSERYNDRHNDRDENQHGGRHNDRNNDGCNDRYNNRHDDRDGRGQDNQHHRSHGHNVNNHNSSCDNDHSDNDDQVSRLKIKWTDYDSDSSAQISLYYDTDQYGQDGTLIAMNILEDPDGESDHYLWDISNIQAGIYFVYAIIDDGNSSSIDYSNNAIIIADGGGQPFLTFKKSERKNERTRNRRALISWNDLDSNSNAVISLYYDNNNTGFDGTLIVDALEENPDGKHDRFLWNTSTLTKGTYYIYARISDETNSYQVYSDKAIVINHHRRGRD